MTRSVLAAGLLAALLAALCVAGCTSPPPGPAPAAIPGQVRPARQYLTGWTRDFIAVVAPAP